MLIHKIQMKDRDAARLILDILKPSTSLLMCKTSEQILMIKSHYLSLDCSLPKNPTICPRHTFPPHQLEKLQNKP